MKLYVCSWSRKKNKLWVEKVITMKYIIASHGQYADGLYSVVKQLAGDEKEIYAILAYIDEETINEKFKQVIQDDNGTWIIFTDILGGSVNQYVINNYNESRFKIIAGINPYCVLSILELNEDEHLDENIRNIINESHKQMCYVNDFIKEKMGGEKYI